MVSGDIEDCTDVIPGNSLTEWKMNEITRWYDLKNGKTLISVSTERSYYKVYL